jgi:hypothetical protein
MSEPGQAETPKISEVDISRQKLVKATDSFMDKVTNAGAFILKWGVGMPTGIAAEFLGAPSNIFTKGALIASAGVLDKVTSKFPDKRPMRLLKGLSEGLWKGGAFGLTSSIAINTIYPQETVFYGPNGQEIFRESQIMLYPDLDHQQKVDSIKAMKNVSGTADSIGNFFNNLGLAPVFNKLGLPNVGASMGNKLPTEVVTDLITQSPHPDIEFTKSLVSTAWVFKPEQAFNNMADKLNTLQSSIFNVQNQAVNAITP